MKNRGKDQQMLKINNVYLGDCLEVMKDLDDNSIDAILTDPPYGISFMGKQWDHTVPGIPFWAEVLRVAKPGTHMLAFGGTRKHHRLMCAIEDAGWEIRDMMMYVYGSGFPKGQDAAWKMHKKACIVCGVMVKCDTEENNRKTTGLISQTKYNMRFVRGTYLQTPVYACSKCGQVLQPFMPEQNIQEHRKAWSESEVIWSEQPCMEGRSNLETSEGELQRCPICQMSHGVFADGAKGWVCDDAQTRHGTISWQIANEDGSCPSYQPQSIEQLNKQSYAFSLERTAQKYRGWNVALKPAWEPVILCRKPIEGTVAENVQKWGTGAMNIGECTIGEDEISCHGGGNNQNRIFGSGSGIPAIEKGSNPHQGRWPANLLLDEESAVMLDEQSGELTSGENPHSRNSAITKNCYGTFIGQRICISRRGTDSGGASRFFYSSKAGKEERDKYIPQGNKHPTVKPNDLLRYLCRLITPPKGVVLDPFCGSGSTGVAAFEEGFNYILIDIDPVSYKTAKIKNAQKRIL